MGRWRPTGTVLARRGQVLTVSSDTVARRGGVGEGEATHLGFRVRVGVGRRKLAGEMVLGFAEGSLVSEVEGG
jgi:hypothetical protein